jgi:hypothetical protein
MTYEFIENKTLREYYEKERIELSDEVTAWLMYNDVSIFDRRWELLTNLANITSNDELRKEILDAKQMEFDALKDFKTKEECTIYTCGIDSMSDELFTDIEYAIDYGVSTIKEYELDDGFVISKAQANNPGCTFIGFYSNDGTLMKLESKKVEYRKFIPFANNMPKLPHPYKRGDLIKYTFLKDDELYGVCTLDNGITLDDWYNDLLSVNGMNPADCKPMITMDFIEYGTNNCYPHLTEILDIDKIELSDIEDKDFRRLMRLYMKAVNTGNGIAAIIYDFVNYGKDKYL